MTELSKYTYRFLIPLLIVFVIGYFFSDSNIIRIVLYKICLVFISMTVAEVIWVLFFKTVFGKMESMGYDDRKIIATFRGIIYGSIILAFTLGL